MRGFLSHSFASHSSSRERDLLSQLRKRVTHITALVNQLEATYLAPPTDVARTGSMVSTADPHGDEGGAQRPSRRSDFAFSRPEKAQQSTDDYEEYWPSPSTQFLKTTYNSVPRFPTYRKSRRRRRATPSVQVPQWQQQQQQQKQEHRQIPQQPNLPPDTFDPEQPLDADHLDQTKSLDRKIPETVEEDSDKLGGLGESLLEWGRDREQKVPDVTDEAQPQHVSSSIPVIFRLSRQPLQDSSVGPPVLPTLKLPSFRELFNQYIPEAHSPSSSYSRLDPGVSDDPTSWESRWNRRLVPNAVNSESDSGTKLELDAMGPNEYSLARSTPCVCLFVISWRII